MDYLNELAKLLSGGESTVRSMYSTSCSLCEQQVRRTEGFLNQGLRADGGGWEETRVEFAGQSGETTTIRVEAINLAGRLIMPDGTVVQDFPAFTYSYVFQVADGDAGPIIIALDEL